jgi:hypothetical protein
LGEEHTGFQTESIPKPLVAPLGSVHFSLYHCQEIGEWSEELITFLDTGKVFSSRRKNVRTSTQNRRLLCDLSNFDICHVTSGYMFQCLQPPKKYCFALKSLQNHDLILKTRNYIHFFTTDDQNLADNFQQYVQDWRTNYLAKKTIDRSNGEEKWNNKSQKPSLVAAANGINSLSNREKVSAAKTAVDIEPIDTLFDTEPATESLGNNEERVSKFSPMVTQEVVHNPETIIRYQSHYPSNPISSPCPSCEVGKGIEIPRKCNEFDPRGLLGARYQILKHQAEARSCARNHQPPESPFTGGLLQSHVKSMRQQSNCSLKRNTSISNTSSTKRLSIPLVETNRDTTTARIATRRLSQHPPPSCLYTTSARSTETRGVFNMAKEETVYPLLGGSTAVSTKARPSQGNRGHGVKVSTGMPLISLARNSWGYWPTNDTTTSPSSPLASPARSTRRANSTLGWESPARATVNLRHSCTTTRIASLEPRPDHHSLTSPQELREELDHSTTHANYTDSHYEHQYFYYYHHHYHQHNQ